MRKEGLRRGGYSILELIVVLTITGIVLAIAIQHGRLVLDRIAVQSAAGDVRMTLALARNLALAGDASVAVEVDSAAATLRVRRGSEVVLTRGIGHAHGVRLARNRDSLTYDHRGLGRGAANLSVVVYRGAAAETVFVSRLGRVR